MLDKMVVQSSYMDDRGSLHEPETHNSAIDQRKTLGFSIPFTSLGSYQLSVAWGGTYLIELG